MVRTGCTTFSRIGSLYPPSNWDSNNKHSRHALCAIFYPLLLCLHVTALLIRTYLTISLRYIYLPTCSPFYQTTLPPPTLYRIGKRSTTFFAIPYENRPCFSVHPYALLQTPQCSASARSFGANSFSINKHYSYYSGDLPSWRSAPFAPCFSCYLTLPYYFAAVHYLCALCACLR